MDPHQRVEAERWLGIAAKLMTARDFIGSKTFATRAREADPNNPVSDQILAVIETILAGEKRVNASQQPDWYSILQLPRLVRDPDLIADHYRRLVLCLNPERNRFPFADYALQLVMDAWSVLSDPTKKWLFDNELALFLQQQPQPQPQQSDAGAVAAVAAAAGGSQLNTFQFFQQQPQQQQQQQPQQQPMWQLQPQQQQHQQNQHQQNQQQQQQQQQHQQQINQREFMPLPQVQSHTQAVSQQQQVPPQWQMRDPTPIKGGERNKQVLNGIGVGIASTTNIPTPTPTPMIPTQAATTTIMRPVPQAPPPAPPPVPQPQPPTQAPVMAAARVTVAAVGNVVDGNAGTVPTTANTATTTINAANNNVVGDNVVNGVDDNAVDEDNDEVVVEEGDCFWTACPYCFYIYEYQKVYLECTLRCQNCRKGFHAVQIPNPPPVTSNNGGKEKGKGKGKGKEKEEEKEKKDNSFCCWGFFPLGFSMTAWKKQQNQRGNMNGSSTWVPFSPMFASPAANGGGNFQWFNNGGGNAFVGPKHAVAKSTPRVYIDDDDEDFLELSESSDMDSSDIEWRTYNQEKTKTKGKKRRRRRGNVGGRRKGRPPKSDVVKQVNQNVASGGGVSVGGEELGDGSTNAQEVVFSLAAGDRPNSSKSMPATLTRKQTRRSVKDVGRLDLNVEFNNDGEEHAPTVSAVNGEEDGIENIAFFEGLDEFLSTLPILNVGGDEKAKPS